MSRSRTEVADLTPEQRALLERRLALRRPNPAAKGTVIRRAGSDLAPLSFAQQRLWFLSQLEPQAAAYNTTGAFRLKGALDVLALERSLGEILRRHEALRTFFEEQGGGPMQRIAPFEALSLRRVTTEVPLPDREEAIRALAVEEANRPFDLARGPLLRAALLRFDAEDHGLALTLHHIASDGWSMGVLKRELSALYDAFSQGEPSPLPELPIQYSDFAVWQREWLQGGALERQLGYWKHQLRAPLPAVELATDRSRPATQSFLGARHDFALSAPLSTALLALARQEGVTPFVVLLAAFRVLLFRHTGQTDVVLGSPVANRNRSEIEGLIGFFANTLVLRADLSGDPTFRELLAKEREGVLEAQAFQDLPFEKLVEELRPERALSRNPLFQVLFVLQNAPRGALALRGLDVEPVRVDVGTVRFDLELHLREESSTLAGAFRYATDLFDGSRIEALAAQYEALLAGIVASPGGRLSELTVVGGVERRRLLEEWNRTEREYPEAGGIGELFEKQARLRPDAVAVVFGEERLSYGELDVRSNRLARYLRKRGVVVGTRVGICAERSLELMVGLLGIVKAGGVYVPLDPEYPQERLEFMVEDSEIELLLTQERLVGRAGSETEVLCLDRELEGIGEEEGSAVESGVGLEDLAYVTYTSGSTGVPKGVEVRHRGVVRLLFGVEYAEFGAAEVFLQLAPVTFDASTLEIWGALLHGGRCVLYPERVPTVLGLGEVVKREGVTTLWLTASLYNAVIDEAPETLLGVKQLLIGGEALSVAHVKRGYAHLKETRIINGYGPTEGTTFTCCYAIPRDVGEVRSIPIGVPIGNTRVYVLDGKMEVVPVGVAGELYIGGAGLGRGYLKRPVLTAERFRPDPFSCEAGARLYQTGDLVRYQSDGNLEFLGRIDQQVKVRGYRIELGEIETILGEHPAVVRCAVVAREEGSGTRRLVAYVVGADGGGSLVSDLKIHLRTKLPEHMVPAAFVVLDELPLSPNGKIDHAALPLPEIGQVHSGSPSVAPRTPLEEILASIFADVLGLERVGVHESFFDLGGHSLLATRAVSRARQALSTEIPLRWFFEAPTVAALAERVDRAGATDPALVAPALTRVDRAGPLPVSFGQERLWLLHELDPRSALHNIAAAIRLKGGLDVQALEQSLGEIVRRHESLRTRFARAGGLAVQVIDPASAWRLPVEDLSGLEAPEREAEARRRATSEARRPFDLARGPLFRARLLRLGEREHVLAFAMHHVVSDGWSVSVLVREWGALYAGFVVGETVALPDLPFRYADYAAWQRQWLRDAPLAAQLAYWKKQLAGMPSVLELPTDHARPATQRHRGARRDLRLSRELTKSLKQLSRREGATLFMVLLAGFQALLSRYSGLSDVVVGSPIAGRTRGELEGLIGFFVNTLVLRTDLSGDPTFRELVGRVKETSLQAYAHQDLPFEKLVEELNPERALSHHPLYQVVFALQNVPRETLELSGLSWKREEIDDDFAKVDLQLMVGEDEQGLLASLRYDRDLFEGATVERMLGHYEGLLRGVVSRPEGRLSELVFLDESERRQVLLDWNATGGEYPRERCFHELFAEEARRRPEGVAAGFGGEFLSYGELERRSNQLARYLRRRGVGPEVLVGLCVEKSLDLVVGLLGILKAGGGYVPLDPAYPQERLRFMVSDSGVGLVVTQENLRETVGGEAELVLLDAEGDEISLESGESLESGASPENVAYVIYTSGSTGIPKGVVVPHRGLVSLTTAQRRHLGVGRESVVLQFSSLSFDASIFEIAMALSAGGRLCLAPRESLLPGPPLLKLLREEGVSIVTLPPSALSMLGTEPLPALKVVTVAGEACSGELVRRWSGGRKFFNLYGPTEATIWATYAECTETSTAPPIGRPIVNVRVYVLDRSLQPVPVGVPGELCVGGVGVARGYLNRPELTAERFVPDPFGAEGGERLYRTGDWARYRADGNLEFLGRIDHQVKVRGYRIEPGEVETVLARHPRVKQCVVVVREDVSGDKRLVGYVVWRDEAGKVGDLREHLREKLPEYMVPSVFVVLNELPLSPSGKVARGALPEPGGRREIGTGYVEPVGEVERAVAKVWGEILGIGQVGLEDNFFDLGGHSLLLVQVHSRLQELYPEGELRIVDLFRYPTVRALSEHLGGGKESTGLEKVRERARLQKESRREAIAIVGMAGRFPRARDLEEFWKNLRSGEECVTFFTEDELKKAGVSAATLETPGYVRARAVLEGTELFDASFFGYTPRDAEVMDPQHRVFLECAWEAIENAGYDTDRYPGLIGVYAGASMSTYLHNNLYRNPELLAEAGRQSVKLGNDKDMLATRASYKLNLRGPSFAVQTACSTSLVAVHVAAQALSSHECDLALAGGVSVTVPQTVGYLYQQEGIGSPDGHCRAFDAKARGTVAGNGVGVVVLKRLADALREGDTIHAVIRGSAINNDGSGKVGFTAPSVQGQAEVIAAAQAVAGVEPGSVTYVEAHGTGTALGDPIEVEALTQAFRDGTERKGFCALGSVKTNIGHLDAAAGIAGLMKTVMALEHGEIPPSLNFEEGNPKIQFGDSPFFVNTRLLEWKGDEGPRRAGVSSFGVGGTNAHVVLEQAPAQTACDPGRPRQLLVLSGRTEAALEQAGLDLGHHLESNPHLSLADVAYTLQVGRRAFERRRAIVCRDVSEARRALAGEELSRTASATAREGSRPVMFLLPGQGAQYAGMGEELYREEEVYREEVDRCSELLADDLGLDLRQVLYPSPGGQQEAERRLQETWLTQPAVFTASWALARTLQSWGITPRGMLGHSVGEYVAACLAGVMPLEAALGLVAARGRLMQGLPGGSMLAVTLPENEILDLLGETLSLAAVNAPRQCVVSGPTVAVAELETRLRERGVETRRLATSHAFHSRMMEPVLAEFESLVSAVRPAAPRIPYVSNVTGKWITADQATEAGYWSRHLRAPVRFADGLVELLGGAGTALLEVGPGQTLGGLARQHPSWGPAHVMASPGRRGGADASESENLLKALGQLWVSGVEVDWPRFHSRSRRRRVPLPTYPFERRRYWVEAPSARAVSPALLVKNPDASSWFEVPVWKSAPPALLGRADEELEGGPWLVLGNDSGPGFQLAAHRRQQGRSVAFVRAGDHFERRAAGEFVVRPGVPEDFRHLLEDLTAGGLAPRVVVHAWSATPPEIEVSSREGFDHAQARGFYSLLSLLQALGRSPSGAPLRLVVVGSHLYDVTGGEILRPERLPILALSRVAAQEFPGITSLGMDLRLDEEGLLDEGALNRLVEECLAGGAGTVVALRGERRWIQAFHPLPLPPAARERMRVRDRGTYLITGGLGEIGLEIAEYLALTTRARLVLVGRTGLPSREEWNGTLERGGESHPVSRRIRRLLALEGLGAEVLAIGADVGDREAMRAVCAQADQRFGGIHGVIHAAGITVGPSLATIDQLEQEDGREQFHAKAQGVYVLEEVLRGRKLDFCLLMSSLSAVLGGLGMGAYAASNLFMDGFAARRVQAGDNAWTSVNWDGWRRGGDGARTEAEGSVAALAMTRSEGVEAFARVLSARPLTQIVVSTADLTTRLGLWVRKPPSGAETAQAGTPSRHARPDLMSPYVAPRDATEGAIAGIWEGLLGIQPVGIHDEFLELGGHSLLATQLVTRLRERFGVEIPLRALFETPTVAGLATRVTSDGQDAKRVAELMLKLKGLSPEERLALVQDQQSLGGA